MSCIFCGIVEREIPADVLYEDDQVLAFPDIHPLTPVHLLIIPKKHLPSMNEVTEEDKELLGHMMLTARNLAKQQFFTDIDGEKKNVAETGYKLLIRTGRYGGQEVPHIHLHLLGGGMMKEHISVE